MSQDAPKHAPPRDPLPFAHLTTVQHVGTKKWRAGCTCPWTKECESERLAVAAAEFHWFRAQDGED